MMILELLIILLIFPALPPLLQRGVFSIFVMCLWLIPPPIRMIVRLSVALL
jgi:hypothetical protein